MTAHQVYDWQNPKEMDVWEYDYPDEQVTYPKISIGDTVFAIEWIQSPFRIEDKGVCLYANLPPASNSMKVGLFRMYSKFGRRPLHIFMPGSSRTEKVTRLNPSYDDIDSNIEIDGYYDKVRDCIVFTGHVDLITREEVYDHKQEPPVINKPELVFETKDKLWSIYSNIMTEPRMIIQLSGCARVEHVDPLVVGDFIGTKCEDKLLNPYNSKTGFGLEDRDVKSEIWNLLPGPISEEINYNMGLEDDEIYRLIDPKKNRLIASFEFKRTSKGPEITFYDAHDKNIGFMNIHTSQRHRIRVWMQWMDDYRDRIVNAPNTRIVICEAMKKLIQHHPEMNRTSESEMRKLEACSRG